MSSNTAGYDVFLSYQWDVKESVLRLYNQLTKTHGLSCWMDVFEMGNGDLNERIINGIRSSRVFVCCVTKKYTESKNCIREISFADQIAKPLEILMFERLNIGEIGGVGFIITPVVRHNVYKTPEIFNEWTGSDFEAILKSIKSRLRPATGRSRPSSSVTPQIVEKKLSTNYTFCKILNGHTNWVNTVSFGSSGHLASGSQDGTIKLWDTQAGSCIKTLNTDHSEGVRGVMFNKEGTLLVSGSDDGKIMLWSIESSACLFTMTGHESVFSVIFSDDGSLIASGSWDKTVRLWNAQTGECLHIMAEHTDKVWDVAFNKNASHLASGSSDKTIKIWDTKTGLCVKTLGDADWVCSLAFRFDDKLASGLGRLGSLIRLWDTETGNCIRTFKGHTKFVCSLAFREDGLLASGSGDGLIKIWNSEAGTCLNTLSINEVDEDVSGLAFDWNNGMLASSSYDRTIRIWNIV